MLFIHTCQGLVNFGTMACLTVPLVSSWDSFPYSIADKNTKWQFTSLYAFMNYTNARNYFTEKF